MDPQRAGRIARMAEAIRAAASPLLRGNLPTEEAWAGMQAIKRKKAWPLLAEFEVGEQGGRLAALHEPLEKWDGTMAAVVTRGERTEPLFFAANHAA
eukprot:9991780-Alexandrium_andersonii.AAC.1